MSEHVQKQQKTGLHRFSVLMYAAVHFLSVISPAFLFGGMVIFFLVTSIKRIWKMLLFMAIVGGLCAVLPFLAPVAVIIMIVLFFIRISYVIRNWRPLLAGVIVYGSAMCIGSIVSFTPLAIFWGVLYGVIGGFVLHRVLCWLYKYNYTSQSALGIMGSVPLIVISFILPFLKLHTGFDGGHDFHVVTDSHASDMSSVDDSIGYISTSPEVITPISQIVDNTAAPDTTLVHVKAHFRTAPDGDVTDNLSYHGPDAKPIDTEHLVHVHGYFRTAPDGDITDNLSYHGPDAKPIDSENLEYVHDYYRTVPDGDITDNLSCHGPDAKPIDSENLGYVHDYYRTVPDGDITDNLSYHGPDAKPIDTEHLVHVRGYYRTTSDGNVTDILSYHVPDTKPIDTEHLLHVNGYYRTASDGDVTENQSYHGPNSKPKDTEYLVHVQDYDRIDPSSNITSLASIKKTNPEVYSKIKEIYGDDKEINEQEHLGYVINQLNVHKWIASSKEESKDQTSIFFDPIIKEESSDRKK